MWDPEQGYQHDIFGAWVYTSSLAVITPVLRLKHTVKEHLRQLGHEVVDKGTHVHDSVDYPDFAHAVADRCV